MEGSELKMNPSYINHDLETFSFIARESLILDLKKRNITFVGFQRRHFLGYELHENGTLNCKTTFGYQSDWVDLVRYTRNIGVNLALRDNKVVVFNQPQRYNKLYITIA